MQTYLGALALLSVVLSTLSQIALKSGMSSAEVQAAIATSNPANTVIAISRSLTILIGLVSFGLSALVWLAVLSRVPLSTAYPIVALGIVATTVAGIFIFEEPLPVVKAIGVSLIVGGVICVAASS